MKIYLDMDGVLTDFAGRYVELFGVTPEQSRADSKDFWNNWRPFVKGGNFETLDWNRGAVELLAYVASLRVPVEILSSSGGGDTHDVVVAQKLKWLESKGIPYKANIVPGGSKKAEFAAPWNILVDDTTRVVETYRKAGGTAILHVDAYDTIKELGRLHLEWRGGE